MLRRQPTLERSPAQCLCLLAPPKRVQRRDAQVSMPDLLAFVPVGCPVQPGERVAGTSMSEQALGNVAGEVLRPSACFNGGDIGVNVPLEVSQVTQAEGDLTAPMP